MRPWPYVQNPVVLVGSLLLLGLAACRETRQIDAPPPATKALTDSLAPLPPSVVDVPVSYDLAPVLAALEAAVPRKFGNLAERRESPGNARIKYAFEAQRNRFEVQFDGRVARISTIVQFRGKGWYDPPIGPELSASCGVGREPPRLRVEILTNVEMMPEWRLRGRSRLSRVEMFSQDRRDQCKVTIIKLDITDKVANAAKEALAQQLPVVDKKIAAIDVRTHFSEWWELMQAPIQLKDRIWLLIQPVAVRLGKIQANGTTLLVTVGLSANPKIVTGDRPIVKVVPLPAATPGAGAPGMHILMEGVLGYELASSMLTKETRGRTIDAGGQKIKLSQVRVSGIGDGRLALEIHFTGDVKGHIYFVGTPKYDLASDQLTVPDLDFDVGTLNMLASGYEWIQHSDMRDTFRERARWPVGGLLRKAREALASGMNRELAPGVQLISTIDTVEAVAVQATRSALVVRAHADGAARLEIKKQP